MSSKVPFTKEQIAYLESLPAVAAASAVRITYTDEFKRSCLTSYYRGGSPVDLFRKAGLPPELIGYKRIERCFSRWRESASEIFAGQGSVGGGVFSTKAWQRPVPFPKTVRRGGIRLRCVTMTPVPVHQASVPRMRIRP